MDSNVKSSTNDVKYSKILLDSLHRNDFYADQAVVDHFNDFSDKLCTTGLDFQGVAIVFELEKEVQFEECEVGGLLNTTGENIDDYGKGAEVQVSINGFNWTTVATLPQDFGINIVTLKFNRVSAKHVRFVREVNNNYETIRLGYFRITH